MLKEADTVLPLDRANGRHRRSDLGASPFLSMKARPGTKPTALPRQVGHLTVTGKLAYRRAGHRYILCRCRCGRMEPVRATTLLRRRKEACEACTRRAAARSRQGLTSHPLYALWQRLKAENKLDRLFQDVRYFVKWGQKHGYHRRRTLYRKDENRPYGPDNAYFR